MAIGQRNREGGRRGGFLRGLLIFVAGALTGANVVYYALRGSVVPPVPTPQGRTQPTPPAPGGAPAASAPTARPPAGPGAATAPPVPVPVPSPDGELVIPVAGVRPAQLVDTYTQSRGQGRLHDAIDIMAPAGTPVLAAVDGPVAKLFASEAGGITLYQFDRAGEYVHYYAHLQGYAPGIAEGRVLRAGEVLGYVGATGNANPASPHLHYSIARLGADRKWHGGTPVNPYPLLSGRPAAAPAPSTAPTAAPVQTAPATTPMQPATATPGTPAAGAR